MEGCFRARSKQLFLIINLRSWFLNYPNNFYLHESMVLLVEMEMYFRYETKTSILIDAVFLN